MSTAKLAAVVAGAAAVAAFAMFLAIRSTPTGTGTGRLVNVAAGRQSPHAPVTATAPSSAPMPTAPRGRTDRLTLPAAFTDAAASNPKIGAAVAVYNRLPATGRATIANIGTFVAQHPDQAGIVCTKLDGVLLDAVTVPGLTTPDGSTIPSGTDIQALAFTVLMEATDDNESDLELIQAETKAQTNAKQFLRQQMAIVAGIVAADVAASQSSSSPTPSPSGRTFLVPAPAHLVTSFQLPAVSGNRLTYYQVDLTSGGQQPVTPDQLRSVQADLQGDLDSMNESSDVTSARLQMAGGAIATTWSLPTLLTEISGTVY